MTPLRVNLRQLEREAIELRGELSAADLELEAVDELIRVNQPVRYALEVQLAGRGVLARGRVWLTLECECCRCLRPFATELDLRDWSLHLALDGPDRVPVRDDGVDLTPFVREDILLAFPQNPVCDPGCAGLPNPSASGVPCSDTTRPGAGTVSAWAVLNKLRL
ncbi:MAG: DUF177 domain-containing protein [Verrucomicrobia bacterium]|nr:DUF177 domain-containing protein [Verrucomicrobiota bacterium]